MKRREENEVLLWRQREIKVAGHLRASCSACLFGWKKTDGGVGVGKVKRQRRVSN